MLSCCVIFYDFVCYCHHYTHSSAKDKSRPSINQPPKRDYVRAEFSCTIHDYLIKPIVLPRLSSHYEIWSPLLNFQYPPKLGISWQRLSLETREHELWRDELFILTFRGFTHPTQPTSCPPIRRICWRPCRTARQAVRRPRSNRRGTVTEGRSITTVSPTHHRRQSLQYKKYCITLNMKNAVSAQCRSFSHLSSHCKICYSNRVSYRNP